MATTGKPSRFAAWCLWTKWIEEAKVQPEKIVTLGPMHYPPGWMDYEYFRFVASLRASEQGCMAHVNVDKRMGIMRLQFCWRKDKHTGLHIDGSRLLVGDFWHWAPYPPNEESR